MSTSKLSRKRSKKARAMALPKAKVGIRREKEVLEVLCPKEEKEREVLYRLRLCLARVVLTLQMSKILRARGAEEVKAANMTRRGAGVDSVLLSVDVS